MRRVVRRRVADWLRRCQHSAERNTEHARDLEDSVHSWMPPDLAFEERELTDLCGRTVERLPIPLAETAPAACRNIAGIARLLARRTDSAAFARLNAEVARLYQLSAAEFEHVETGAWK